MAETAIQYPPAATTTALVVEVPEVEPVVGDYRAAMDAHSANGVNAHVTVLFPFMPPGEVTRAVLDGVEDAVEQFDAFECTFRDVGWFGEDVLWLAPEPTSTFRAMTRAIVDRFPDYPPYGGEFPDSVPHLTVAHGDVVDFRAKLAAAQKIRALLPITARVGQVRMIAGSDEAPWRTVAEFPLR